MFRLYSSHDKIFHALIKNALHKSNFDTSHVVNALVENALQKSNFYKCHIVHALIELPPLHPICLTSSRLMPMLHI